MTPAARMAKFFSEAVGGATDGKTSYHLWYNRAYDDWLACPPFSPTFCGLHRIIMEMVKDKKRDIVPFFVPKKTTVTSVAPHRAWPRSVYDPEGFAPSSYGDNIPSWMAHVKREYPNQWVMLHDGLVGFGRDSGLWENVEVQNCDDNEKPFFIAFTVNGEQINFSDMGFSVGQVLPVLVNILSPTGNILNPTSRDMVLIQNPETYLDSEGKEAMALALVSAVRTGQRKLIVESHDEVLVNSIRKQVDDKEIDADKVNVVTITKTNHGTWAH